MAKQSGQLSQQCEFNHQWSPVRASPLLTALGTFKPFAWVKLLCQQMNIRWVFSETGHCISADTQCLWPWSPPALAVLVLGVQIRNERLQPSADALPGHAWSSLAQTPPDAFTTPIQRRLSASANTPSRVSQPQPAITGLSACQGPGVGLPAHPKNKRCLHASSKHTTVWAEHTPKPETTEMERQARQPRQWRERQRFKYFRQRFSKAEIAYNSLPNSRELTWGT